MCGRCGNLGPPLSVDKLAMHMVCSPLKLKELGINKGEQYKDQLIYHLQFTDCHLKCGRIRAITAGNKAYVNRLRNGQHWWDQDFIHGVMALIQHDAHSINPPFKNDLRIMLVTGGYNVKK